MGADDRPNLTATDHSMWEPGRADACPAERHTLSARSVAESCLTRSRRPRCAAPLTRRQRQALPWEARPAHAGPAQQSMRIITIHQAGRLVHGCLHRLRPLHDTVSLTPCLASQLSAARRGRCDHLVSKVGAYGPGSLPRAVVQDLVAIKSMTSYAPTKLCVVLQGWYSENAPKAAVNRGRELRGCLQIFYPVLEIFVRLW